MSEIIVGAHVTGKKLVRYCSFCPKWRLGNVLVKGVILKRIGIAKSSSDYKSSNKIEKCLMIFCRYETNISFILYFFICESTKLSSPVKIFFFYLQFESAIRIYIL
jgi:hypothetical protein